MSILERAPEAGARRGWHFLHHHLKKLSPAELLRNKFQLTRGERLVQTVWGTVMSQIANPVGSAIYFVLTQLSYAIAYPKGHVTYFNGYLGDTWDRLPVHVENLLHQHWWASQAAPPSWVDARHDARYVLIGMIAVYLVRSITVGFGKKEQEPLGKYGLLGYFVLSALVTIPGLVIGILFFTHVLPAIGHWGVFANNSYFGDWTGPGKWQLIVIGIMASLPGKRVFNRVASTLQLISIDNKLLQQETEKLWWKLAYTPAYRKRFAYMQARQAAGDYTPRPHGKVLGVVLFVGVFAFVILLAVGIWLRYFGPAKGA